jgi:hypothetical protein
MAIEVAYTNISMLKLQRAVSRLWNTPFHDADTALSSREFGGLLRVCLELYCGPGSYHEVNSETDCNAQRHGLKNLLRAIGAPWWRNAIPPSPEQAASAIEHAYSVAVQTRIQMMPLDMSDPLPEATFGPWKIRKFSAPELESIVQPARQARFWPNRVFDVGRFSQFQWLFRQFEEPTRPVHKEVWPFFYDDVRWAFGIVDPRPSKFGGSFDLPLMTVALYPWETFGGGKIEPWRPFRIPWVYTVSDNPFIEPQIAPLPQSLSWQRYFIGNGEVEERPLEMGVLDEPPSDFEQQLQDVWSELSIVAPNGEFTAPAFRPPVTHFFLRGFHESGIDEMLSHVIAIEAALGRSNERTKKNTVSAEGWSH